jgi:hypothetical protein
MCVHRDASAQHRPRAFSEEFIDGDGGSPRDPVVGMASGGRCAEMTVRIRAAHQQSTITSVKAMSHETTRRRITAHRPARGLPGVG